MKSSTGHENLGDGYDASDSSLHHRYFHKQRMVVEPQQTAGSNCDEQSVSEEECEELSSSDMGDEKLPFNKLARSPVRWTDLHHKKNRRVSPMAYGNKPANKRLDSLPWKATLSHFSIERDSRNVDLKAASASDLSADSESKRSHIRRGDKSKKWIQPDDMDQHSGASED